MKSYSHGYIYTVIWMISLSFAYKTCFKPDPRKTAYGLSCTENSQCFTDFCSTSTRTCLCPLSLAPDSNSGLCVNGAFTITSNPGDCGYIVSPSNISERSEVSWTISGSYETYITIVILEIDMIPVCTYNYVEIKEDSTSLLNKNCDRNNSTLRFFASKSNRLTINYKKVPNDCRGFRAIYYTRSRFSDLSEATGYIASPGYPLSYNMRLNQTWLISVLPERIIETIFLVDIRSNVDYVKVYDGRSMNSPLLQPLTGSVSLFSVRSSANFMLIQFTTATATTLAGFSATYKSYTLYGYKCISDDDCVQGLVCSYNLCSCRLYEKYEGTIKTCIPRLSFGHSCQHSEECFQDLVCQNSVCRCPTNQYYDSVLRLCRNRIAYGHTCNNTNQCVVGLTCDGSGCICSTNQYYISGLTSPCYPRLTYGKYCTSTRQCQLDFECNGNFCNCSSNKYYNNRTCLAKRSHAERCSTSEECLTSFLCRSEKISINLCLCPSNMYFNISQCISHLTLQAAVSNSSTVKTESIFLKWTTQFWKANFIFTVERGNNSVLTNRTELYLDGLSPGRAYNFTITTNIPADNYYNNKSVVSNFWILTKQAPGYTCSDNDNCSEEASCIKGICTCSNQFYLKLNSKTCELRLNKGYECTESDECKEKMICKSGRCGCLSGYYYDSNRLGCYRASEGGQLCDPSIDDICELPNYSCTRLYTLNYTCKISYKNPYNYPYESGSQKSTCKDNSNTVTVCIAIAVVSWIITFASIIVMCKLCKRNRKNARAKGNIPIAQSSQVTVRTTPTSLPNNTGQIRNTSTMASIPVVSSQVQTTPATSSTSTTTTSTNTTNTTNTNTTTTTTNVSTSNPSLSVTNYSRHANQTYTRNKTDSFEETYENILAYLNDDPNEEVYINVRFPKQNSPNNSNI